MKIGAGSMKKILIFILIALLILSGCTPKKGDDTVQENDPRLADRTQNAEYLETDEYYYWRGDGCPYLMYYDKSTDQSGVLCARADCMHNNDPDCWGNIMSVGTALTMLNGRLYWVGEYNEGEKYYISIMSMNPDSSERRLERKLDLPDNVIPHKYFFHHGELYIYSRFSNVKDGVPSYIEALYVTSIDNKEIRTVFEREIPPLEGSGMEFKFIGDSVYYYINSSSENGDGFAYEFYRYDIPSGNEEPLFNIEGNFTVYGFWPEGEDILISTVDNETYLSGFYRVRNGQMQLIADFADEEGLYVFPRVSDGIVYTTASSEETSVINIWIKDWEGNTLYKGLLPMGFLDGAEPEFIGFSSDWGDKNAVFFDHEVGMEDGSVMHYLVRYDIMEGGLAEELLISEASYN